MKHSIFILLITFLCTLNASADSENVSYLWKKCVERNMMELDDGSTNAEIIGELIVQECRNECMVFGKAAAAKSNTPFDAKFRQDTTEWCIKGATKAVLQNRTHKNRDGIVDSYYIGNWRYESNEDELMKGCRLIAKLSRNEFFIIECIDSNDEKIANSGLTIRLITDYEVKDFKGSQSEMFGKDLIQFDIKLDGQRNYKRRLYWFKGSKQGASLIGPQLYPFIEELKKSKTLKIIANPDMPSITIDLTDLTRALDKLTGQCKTFYKDKK